MSILQALVIATSAAILMLSMYLYSPAPYGVEDPRLVQAHVAMYRLADLVASTVHLVTGVSALSVLRAQIEMMYTPVKSLSSSNTLQRFRFIMFLPVLLKSDVENLHMEGIPVRMYKPQNTGSSSDFHLMPCVVYFHGGGWALFSIDSYDTVARQLSENTSVTVISVEYRLAPEYPFPTPFEDCVKVARHVLHHGEQYKIDPRRVAVAGDGTGGNLAAAVALRLSEEDDDSMPALKLQILIQPVLQALTFNTPSYRENAFYSLVDRAKMIKYWCYYMGFEPTPKVLSSMERGRHVSPTTRRILYSVYMGDAEIVDKLSRQKDLGSAGDAGGGSNKNPDLDEPDYDPDIAQAGPGVEARVQDVYFAPIMAYSIPRVVAPALVLVGDQDIARDDGLLYTRRLLQAGVKATLKRLPATGQGHVAPLLPRTYWGGWFTFSGSAPAWSQVYSFVKDNL